MMERRQAARERVKGKGNKISRKPRRE